MPNEQNAGSGIDPNAVHATRSLLSSLLDDVKLYRSSKNYKELLDFIVRLRHFAPFNAMLLHVQKPGMRFAASQRDWERRFNRTIAEGARPLLILWPFGPVALVYDVEDTEGFDLPADVAQFFRASGNMTKEKMQEFARRLAFQRINLKSIPFGEGHAGHINIDVKRKAIEKKQRTFYQIRLNENHQPNVQFATLAHELAHLFLGHLGPDKDLNIPERPSLTEQQREFEAESVSFLLCKRNDVHSNAETYLGARVSANTTTDDLDFFLVIKAAGRIEAALGLATKMEFA